MKKQKFNLQKVAFSFLIFCLVSIQAQAQSLEDALGFSETVNDVPEAPIHFLIPFLLLIGGYLGVKKNEIVCNKT